MPKWRKLHVKATESLDINDMPDDFHRLLWVMLPLGLDCEGRGLDNPSWVKSKIMPLRTDVTMQMVDDAMRWYGARGMVEFYEVDGRRYFWVPSFPRYQGDTSKEASSEYPAPPTELVESNSRPTPELVESKSRSDVDVDVDVDSEEDAPQPQPRKRTARQELTANLVSVFCEVSSLDPPPRSTQKQQREAARLWWNPLLEIARVCDNDVDRTKRLMAHTLALMDKDGLTVTTPNSIKKVALAEQAKRKRDGINPASETNSNGQPEYADGPGKPYSEVLAERRARAEQHQGSAGAVG